MAPHDRRYVLHRALASGGAATVHIGRLLAPGGFARRVAIKRLHPAVASDAEVAAEFAQEARISARIAHANVAAVLDVVAADSELLLVMEYVHGETLSRLLMTARAAKTSPAIGIVAGVVIDVLHGLHAAHEATAEDGTPLRIVHRDVSPQNVLVGADGSARVVDFGIAKALTSAGVTREGVVKGKIPYMAPEQLLRRGIDRRVDVYAAGVILWEALAGRRLFVGDDEPSLFSKVLEERVPPPSASNGEVSGALDAIVMRAIERDPARRFATARDMAIALEGAVARAPLSAVGDWVATTASEALAKRAAMIAEMERDSLSTSGHEVRAPQASVIFRDEEGAAPAVTAEEAPRRRRGALWIAVGAAVVAVLGGAAVWSTSERREPPTAPAAAVVPPVETIAPAPSPPPPPEPAASPPQPPPAPVTTKVSAGSSRGAASTRWCKVFDPDKKIFVMKPMRVARCP